MSSSFRALLLSAVAGASLAALQAAGQVAQAQGGIVAWTPILATGLVAFLTSLLLSLFHLELPSGQQAQMVAGLTQLLDAHTAPAVPLAMPIRRADLAAVPVPVAPDSPNAAQSHKDAPTAPPAAPVAVVPVAVVAPSGAVG